jgi:transcriptional regulator with XRE-family HTH domain
LGTFRPMPPVTRIHKSKQPRRPHYVQEWAEYRGYKSQAELIEASGADKSTVSRWYSGSSPSVEWQIKLAELFDCEPESLFRHPDDDWFAKFFADREREEIERMKISLQASFPRKAG